MTKLYLHTMLQPINQPLNTTQTVIKYYQNDIKIAYLYTTHFILKHNKEKNINNITYSCVYIGQTSLSTIKNIVDNHYVHKNKKKFRMDLACKTFIKCDMKIYDLIEENHTLLLMMQHFEIDFRVDELTVAQICSNNNIKEKLFIAVANLYNGYKPKANPIQDIDDVMLIIKFLRNSHIYYREDKYPEISEYIHQLQDKHPGKELLLLELFFNEYFTEVIDHLAYEDNIAFPYFVKLINKRQENKVNIDTEYSAKEYSEHHTDIELKLKDLKSLLLKHISIPSGLTLKRKLLTSLFELEYDLYIHSLIEETILIPFGYNMEMEKAT